MSSNGRKLKWQMLFSGKRIRETTTSKEDHRNAFEKDYDRIIGSSSVRRLQDKTQVFPMQENDFTRTRLTHSLEVSAIAKSLGKAVGKKLQDIDKNFTEAHTDQLVSLLQTAGLVHDLGNPPFGHYGERIIRKWFSSYFSEKNQTEQNGKLKPEEKKDYTFFDGNAQTIRILSKLQMLNDQYGVNFSYGTLATLIKNPWPSGSENAQKKGKHGFFQSEKDLVEKIWESTGLSENIRHPATFLLEAADDIAYICDDIEDGVKKSVLNWEYECKRNKTARLNNIFKDVIGKTKEISQKRLKSMPEKNSAEVLNFRNIAQGKMIMHARDQFIKNYDSIMNGMLKDELLALDPDMKAFVENLKTIAMENCFKCKEVISLELTGDKVIRSLLDIFMNLNLKEHLNIKSYDGKLFNIISPNFRYISAFNYSSGKRNKKPISLYRKIQLIVDYISGMTDSFAVNLYKELAGFKLP